MDSTMVAASTDRRALVSLLARLRNSKGQQDPNPIYAELRALGEVIPAPWGGCLITSYSLCDRILRDKNWKVPDREWRTRQGDIARWNSPASRQMAATLPLLNPPQHTRERKTLGNPFQQGALPNLAPGIERAAERHLDTFFDHLRDEGPADFAALVGEQLPVTAIGEWMGIKPDDYALLTSLTHDQVYAQELFPSRTQLAISDGATAQLRAYFTDFIKDRRNDPGSDPVSHWLQAWDAREVDQDAADEAVHALTIFMILAALETTSHVLTGTVRLLLEHPDQMEWLRLHPEAVPEAIEESLRYDAPIHLISRVATTHTTLGGVPVRAGDMVHLMVGAAHHDPAQWPSPETFDIRRRHAGSAGPPHLSFGAGVHYCLGSPLARLEANILINALLKRPRLRVHAPAEFAARTAFRRLTKFELTRA
ncbi:cytochrome P450 [Streptomyces sp. NPDC094468]|uniref:cytochrome P450 n=1 Tax=Streptomyces sp. NPDC094468 TaxID=3366066 RepID=UPI00382A3E1D